MNDISTPYNDRRAQLIADANRCVKCAVCLPHCPTYLLNRNEGDSPRGRIALIDALARGEIKVSTRVQEHLDGCLSCRTCEAVCPASVPYGRLIDNARAEFPVNGSRRWLSRTSHWIIHHPRILRWLALAAPFFKNLPVPRHLSIWVRSIKPMPKLISQKDGDPPVALFLGCVARVVDTDTLRDTARVLSLAGYKVNIPAGQSCCGALDQHAGRVKRSTQFADGNITAFSGLQPVVCTASGCSATLVDYGRCASDRNAGEDMAQRIVSISKLLLHEQRWRHLPLSSDPVKVVLYTPCTERNVLKDNSPRQLLEKLPGVQILPWQAPSSCCGAAGEYFVNRPKDAAALRQPIVDALSSINADVIISNNVGCRMHLQTGLAEKLAHPPPLLHLASFIASRLMTPKDT